MAKKKLVIREPKNLAEQYIFSIKTRLYPNEEYSNPGQFVFIDGSFLNFDKENNYYPTTIHTTNTHSIANKLLADLVNFKTILSNTNEVGFEMTLKDKSLFRQVPTGRFIPLSNEDLDKMSVFTKEDIERAQAFVEKHSPKLNALLNAKTINRQKRD